MTGIDAPATKPPEFTSNAMAQVSVSVSVSKKRYRTAVCAIAKDENRYILEWTAYHLALGFDHVFLYDNMSRPSVADVFDLQQLRRRASITLWPTITGRDAQIEAYNHYALTHGRDVEWTAFIDLDELINLKRHQTIGDFVEAHAGADGIAINWRIFGSAGEEAYRPGLAMERFTRASHIDFHPNRLIKSVVRTERVAGLSHHYALFSDAARIVAPDGALVDNRSEVEPCGSSFAVAQINHYFVRSRAEWAAKVARGYTDGTVRDPGLFDAYDRNEIEDRTILRRRRLTRRWMRRLRKPERFSWRSVGTRPMARMIRATRESIHDALKIGSTRAGNE